MSEGAIEITPAGALEKLSEGLEEYKRVSGKLSTAILVQKGGQLIYGNQDPKFGKQFKGLAQLFFDQVPAEGSITKAARARHFRLARKVYGGDLSPHALELARQMMGGFKTILISSREDGSGLSFVRAGVRKKRVHYRIGRKSFAVSGQGNTEFVGGLQKQPGEKAVNIRAVATFFELMLREHGRRFLAASWLYSRWRKLAQSDPRRVRGSVWRVLVNNNPRSLVSPLGQAQLEGDEDRGDIALRISSYVPGVKGVGETRGLFVRAIEAVAADMAEYLAEKHREELADRIHEALGEAAEAIS